MFFDCKDISTDMQLEGLFKSTQKMFLVGIYNKHQSDCSFY